MSDTNKLFYLDREGLKKYDELIKEYINGRDSVIKGTLVEGDYQSVKELSDTLNGLNSEIDNIDDIPNSDIYALFDMGVWGDGYTLITLKKVDISNITYEEVDLGLSVNWANKNIGAQTEEDCGTYFSWGNTDGYTISGTKFLTVEEACQLVEIFWGGTITTKEELENILSQVQMTMDNFGIVDGYSFDEDTYSTTKGASLTSDITSENDAATFNCGSEWRMPTIDEFEELVNAVKSSDGTKGTLTCQYEYIDLNGEQQSLVVYNDDAESGYFNVEGLIVDDGPIFKTFKTILGIRFTNDTGASVYFPMGGSCGDSLLAEIGACGYYWSSSLSYNIVTDLRFTPNGIGTGEAWEIFGENIRAVKQKQ